MLLWTIKETKKARLWARVWGPQIHCGSSSFLFLLTLNVKSTRTYKSSDAKGVIKGHMALAVFSGSSFAHSKVSSVIILKVRQKMKKKQKMQKTTPKQTKKPSLKTKQTIPTKQTKQWQCVLKAVLFVLTEHTSISTSCLEQRQLDRALIDSGLSHEQEQTTSAPQFLWLFSD